MKAYSALRSVRTATAILMIIIISVSFIDIYGIFNPETARFAALTQFIPSLTGFISRPSLIFSFFFIIILFTIVAGRSYCSFICPLGIFQDVIIRLSSVFRLNKKFSYIKPLNFLRYSILTAAAVYYTAAGTFLLVWLDPFSIYGRFASGILSPAVTGINNYAALKLSKYNLYHLHSVDIKYAETGILFITATVIVSISAAAALKGRIYCNTVCPAGSLLGLIANFSVFKITIDRESCRHCSGCAKVCKSSCISQKDETVDFSRCVSCFNCLSVCPESCIGFTFSYSGHETDRSTGDENQITGHGSEITRIGRRSFISGMLFLPSVLHSGTGPEKQQLYIQDRSKQKEYKRKKFSSPPGSSGLELFNTRCTACSLCISRCPSSVLQPAVMQYGIYGIMQPFLDFGTGYCNYDCTVCSEVCPTGAISKISVAEKNLTQTGKSVFVKENCITYTNGTACGACSEHCPTKAADMVPFRDGLVIPEVNQDICIGCGACEFVCPVRPLKAIYVEGNIVHERAELPKKEKKIIIEKEGFPF